MTSRVSSSEARGFDPLQGIQWTAETTIEAVKKLVREREQIFAKHRALANPLDIPIFPISYSNTTLFIYAKRSWQFASYKGTWRKLIAFRRETKILWKDVHGLDDLEDELEAERVLKEYVEEENTNTEDSDSSDSDESSEAEENAEDYHEQEAEGDDENSESSDDEEVFKQLSVPNLPRHGDRFSSADDLLVAAYRALVPIYGHGVSLFEHANKTITIKCGRAHTSYSKEDQGRCRWRIGTTFDKSTREFVVDDRRSYLYHNHGKSSKFRQNPSWRPKILNPVVREAFGLAPLTSAIGKRKAPASSRARPSKKAKLAKSSNSTEAPRSHRISSSSRPATSTSSYPTSSTFGTLSTSPPPSSQFRPQLEAFLRGLHVSLAPLATHLISAGVETLETLTLLCFLDSSTLNKFLEAVQQKAQSSNHSISIIHLKMLAKLVKEAKDGGFAA
ncbi:hypothetical protein JCM3765_001685 [Sporobolomyces pararoseus]